ncbi:NAD(P)/FAD-dependent oxidoreductase [Zavarzinia sp. CC-PAN008]|uniref:NAD(P)/FAD-dependent oxidoreductase n=1 Tax=Zavarzinia sp. CC-PAN008 TaxID=3243332 RepID=UPI003F742B53
MPDGYLEQSDRSLRIAVVGSGIAGLSAAWLLSSRHRVTLFEQDSRPGGHAHTVDVPGPRGTIAVDTGFIVYNEPNYPNLSALYRHLGVPTRPSTMSFSASVGANGALEYSSVDLNRLFGQRRNLLRPRFWRMLRDILRFSREGLALAGPDGSAADAAVLDLSLGEYLDREGYSQAFISDHILPISAAIWSTAPEAVRAYPLASFLRFFASHGLLNVTRRPAWRTVDGGSRLGVQALLKPVQDVRLGQPVRRITRPWDSDARVYVETDASGTEAFDAVVIAAHADQALAMLGDADTAERQVLGAFHYTPNEAVLHSDASLMPRRRRVWSSWNFCSTGDARDRVNVTYWMNCLQSLDPAVPLFVSLNPMRQPRPETVLGRFSYSHPFYDAGALQAQGALCQIQGLRRTWFCGSYFGYGFHEDALQSGLAVAELAGNVRRPWTVAAESGRIPPMTLPTRIAG